MNRLRSTLLVVGALFSMTPAILADSAQVAERAGIIRQGVSGTTYSQELPELFRGQGTAFFKTFVAFTNNTNSNGVTASYQFSYTCISTACSPAGGFYRTAVQTITLPALGSFVQDDFIDYLNTQGLLQPGANQGALGTLLVTFANLPSSNGWEANVVARTYNRIVEADPTQGTVGFAFNASEFFDSADTTLVGYGHNTELAPTAAGKVRTNIGVRNTDINGTNQNMTVVITCYDTATGAKVGSPITFADLKPGEVRQQNLWGAAAIPTTVTNVIIFADAQNPTATSPTMEGYVTLIDGQNTQDAALFTLLCGDANGCGN
ncbi:MAG TPA: hypothetical protein VLU06_08870 [Thermoanaerobaculia bacterium]|nr:hypothetical protein [Thermoanaerobaculia bacterium]